MKTQLKGIVTYVSSKTGINCTGRGRTQNTYFEPLTFRAGGRGHLSFKAVQRGRGTRHRCIGLVLFVVCFAASYAALAQTSTWEPMNRGLKHLLVYTIEVDPVDSLRMFCGTEYGNVYTSTDGGYNWMLSRNGIPADYDNELTTAMWLDKLDRNLLYVGFGGRKQKKNLFKSVDRGVSWLPVHTPDSMPDGGILYLYRVTGAPSILYCGLGWYSGIWFSTDEGGSWTQVLKGRGVQAIAGHRDTPLNLLVGFSDYVDKGFLMRTMDAGQHWARIDSGIKKNGNTGVRAFGIDPTDPNIAYAGVTGTEEPGLYKTTNFGLYWTKLIPEDQISEIAVHPRNPNLIYFTHVYKGVFRTTDGGVTWSLISQGLPVTANPTFMRVRIAPGYPVRVFVVTLQHGIYRLVDEELPESMFR